MVTTETNNTNGNMNMNTLKEKVLNNKHTMALIDNNDPRRAAIRFSHITGYPITGARRAVNAVLESKGLPLVLDWTDIVKAPKGFVGSSTIDVVDSYIGGGINF